MTRCSRTATHLRSGPRWRVGEQGDARTLRFSETRQYGLSYADLARILPRLLPGATLTREGDHYHFALSEQQTVSITQGPEQERRLGGIRIPFVDLRFDFNGFDATQREHFQARFDRGFQKGGG